VHTIHEFCKRLFISNNDYFDVIMEKGDIFWAKDCESHPHPIVFIEEIDNVRFKACILSSEGVSINELMEPKHFCIYDNNRRKYSFQFANTHLVKTRYLSK
jgi:hypothetical protein